MHIAIFTNSDIGFYKFRREFVEKLCEKYKVTIILPNGNYIKYLENMGCNYINFEFNRRKINILSEVIHLYKYIKIIKFLQPDIILTYTIKPNIYGGIASQYTHIPYIVNITGLGSAIKNNTILRFISLSCYKIALMRASCIFFQNIDNRKIFIDNNIIKKNRLIPGSGVNLKIYAVEPYPSDENGINFLFVGRIMREKGICELTLSMRKVRSKYKNIVLHMVGWFEGDYSENLHSMKDDGIIYHGMHDDVRYFYKNAHCTVLPSYHEGMSNVLLEAAATGRPVITTRVPGCQETFEEGVTGFGCEPRNVDSLVAAMEKFLALTPAQREEMGRKGREKMEREFDRNIVVQAYMEEIHAALTMKEHHASL